MSESPLPESSVGATAGVAAARVAAPLRSVGVAIADVGGVPRSAAHSSPAVMKLRTENRRMATPFGLRSRTGLRLGLRRLGR